jgi:hypothetical protein
VPDTPLGTVAGPVVARPAVIEKGWPVVRTAEHFHGSWPTAKRPATRYAEMGPAGNDRSSPPRHRSPNRTSQKVMRRITVIDDHSWVVYAKTHDDETAATVVGC